LHKRPTTSLSTAASAALTMKKIMGTVASKNKAKAVSPTTAEPRV
jgi:hypothetical protein